MPSPTGMQIYDTQGHRLYLTGSERATFRTAVEAAPREVRTYCWTLLYSSTLFRDSLWYGMASRRMAHADTLGCRLPSAVAVAIPPELIDVNWRINRHGFPLAR